MAIGHRPSLLACEYCKDRALVIYQGYKFVFIESRQNIC